MRSRWIVPLAFLSVGSPASAQSYDWGIQCLPGSLQACASVRATIFNSVLADGMLRSELRIRLSNLQGTPGFGDQARYGLSSLIFNTVALTETSSRGNGISHVGSEGNATIGAEFDEAEAYPPHGQVFQFWNPSHLWGCDIIANAYPEQDSTCGGSITYSAMYYQNHYAFQQNPSVRLGWFEYGEDFYDARGSASCTAGVDCTMVTPEPLTLVLFGTGLAGIAAVRSRRRRQV